MSCSSKHLCWYWDALLVNCSQGWNFNWSLICRNKQTVLWNVDPYRAEIHGLSLCDQLSHCWWWRLTDTTADTLTELTADLALPRRDWVLNAGVSCDSNKNGSLHTDKLTDYWVNNYQFHTGFYSKAMKRNRYLHIIRLLHCIGKDNEPDMTEENSDRLCKIRNFFDILNNKFSKFHSPSEHLAVDEVIVLFKGRVVFRQCILKKHKGVGIKIYKTSDETVYT